MATVRVKHVHLVRGKWRWIAPKPYRAAGAVSEYLTRDSVLSAKAMERAEGLNAWWSAAVAEGRGARPAAQVIPGSLGALIPAFQRSPDYKGMKPRTREGVDWALAVIARNPISEPPVGRIEPRDCLLFHQTVLDKKGPHQAKRALTWLRRLLSFARLRGMTAHNPAGKLGLRSEPPREQVWTVQQIDAFKVAAIAAGRLSIALAVQLAYDSAQREADILGAAWSQFDGEGLSWRQGKTGRKVWTALGAETLAMLAATPRASTQIVVSETTGRPYHQRGSFGRVFRKIRKAAELPPELRFHDLRRTAASEVMAGGGRAEPLTGHRPGSPVLRVYEVPNKDAARAAQAARRGTKGG